MSESFTHVLQKAFPKDDTEIEINTGNFGKHAFIRNINGDDVQYAIKKIELSDSDVKFAVTETGSGVGMEAWSL